MIYLLESKAGAFKLVKRKNVKHVYIYISNMSGMPLCT